jgi:hypothetical protein
MLVGCRGSSLAQIQQEEHSARTRKRHGAALKMSPPGPSRHLLRRTTFVSNWGQTGHIADIADVVNDPSLTASQFRHSVVSDPFVVWFARSDQQRPDRRNTIPILPEDRTLR